DMDLFKRRAHRLLNILADSLKIFPEAIAIHGVTLLKFHPVKAGGFANIYHGTYTNTDEEQVEVALKVLKLFRDQSDDSRRAILRKFAKEALVWHYLRHPNIVPLLGVDGTTFPGLTMAMVSPWMRQGSVLNYMTEHSPSSQYAITLLNDVIQGLMYLHSENIVHGDLCARNILIHERQACLTDFGLATFIELDTSKKSSTRSGSTRWMAPELLLPDQYQPGVPFKRTPASDVWAFGCVCCEVGFPHFEVHNTDLSGRYGQRDKSHFSICRTALLFPLSPRLMQMVQSPTKRYRSTRREPRCRAICGNWYNRALHTKPQCDLP
ncbi:kinase-like domain-containing protein, partial [Mycena leptocephala]